MRAPTSTYRLQISASFDLFEATRRLPYLHDLGVDWVYLSPLLVAEPGSNHGYDVVAHDRIDPARGGEAGLSALSAEARRLGMGVLVDIVPNHVGVATPKANAWWWDVLTHGRESAHAHCFDVDWDLGRGRVRIPVLGDDADLTVDLRLEDGELRYADHAYPIAPGTGSGTPAEVHDRQHYELVSWRVADSSLNYRRFFAVNTLAGVRVEDRAVFDATHVEIKRWFDEGLVDGLRVDHPDGLRDPGGYLDWLAELTGGAYVLVEKILHPGEELVPAWATAGTTGYDALAFVDRVLTDPAGQEPLDALETRLRGAEVDWPQLTQDSKRTMADGILGSEIRRTARDLDAEEPPVVDALAELAASLPVYRTYLPDGREHLDEGFAAARHRRPDLDETLDRLEPALTDPAQPATLRFQQLTGAVTAKGIEDSAFYRWSRLTSLNEVGGDPSVFAISTAEFHESMQLRQETSPHAMTCLSTHDTKRGEDVRARITVLSEIPDVWEHALSELLRLAPLPDPGFGSLLWQAILGCWPSSSDPELRERLHRYAEKAMREAGDRTTWPAPDAGYEKVVHAAVDAAFDSDEVTAVLRDLLEHVVEPGRVNGLSAKLVSITMPGVPDVYQGSELWEQSLVDPDNRRPVDFDTRSSRLDRLLGGGRIARPRDDDDGEVKLLVTSTALRLRRDRPELFTSYSPVTATGSAAAHVLAFDRGGAITVATRLPAGLDGWGDTQVDLPPGRWRNLLTGMAASPRLAELLDFYPVALLVRNEP